MRDTRKIRGLQAAALMLVMVMLAYFTGECTFDAYKAEALEPYRIDTCSEEEMFQRYIGTLLEEKLYTSRDAYDAVHYLMVPMYYAFQSEKKEYIEMFRKSMERQSECMSHERTLELASVDRIQYLYLQTQYAGLCAEYQVPVSEDLFTLLLQEVEDYADSYTGSWESPADYQNFWELLDGLLDGEGYGNGKSYEHIITGNDLKILAMLCDLKYVLEESQLEVNCDKESLDLAVDYANRIMESQITWYEDGTWQFQVGAWRDYPDYQFAGIDDPEKIEEGVDYRVWDCVWDTNHFMRFPLLLRSYQRVQSSQEKWDFYDRLLKGAGKFPLDTVGQETYRDPVTVRAQNPIFLMENYEQFLCYLAGKLRF